MEIQSCYENFNTNYVVDFGDIFSKELFEKVISCLRLGRDDAIIGAFTRVNKTFCGLTLNIFKKIQVDESLQFLNCLKLDINKFVGEQPHDVEVITLEIKLERIKDVQQDILNLSNQIDSSKSLIEIKSSVANFEYTVCKTISDTLDIPLTIYHEAKQNIPYLFGPVFETAQHYYPLSDKKLTDWFSLCDIYINDKKWHMAEKMLEDIAKLVLRWDNEYLQESLPDVCKKYCELKNFDKALDFINKIEDKEQKEASLLFYKNAGGIVSPDTCTIF